jgi:hypothetical protein
MATEVARIAPTLRASQATLDELADIVPGPHLEAYVAELKRIRAEKRNGTATLEAEFSFGRITDSWSDTHLRPRRSGR